MDKSITVERVRHALVVGRLDTDGAAVLLAANLPAKRDRTFVVVGASSVDAMTRLDPWLLADLADEVRGDLCVVAPGFGAMGADGKLPLARLLADRLGVEVTAADGDPVGLADGSVFVPGRTAGWVSYRPGGQRIRVGARLPAPWWQEGLPAPEDHITHVPVGLWVRRPGAPERPDDPLLRGVPDHDRMYVVVGAPGEEPPSSSDVAEVLRALPDEGRDRAVLAWYGTGGLAQEVADELDAPVRAAHGVPGDGGLVYVDGMGVARWRPFAVESVYRPGGAPVLDRWVAPPGLAMAGPGSYRLTDGWRVDVVPRGLVVRPEPVAVTGFSAVDTGPAAEVVFAVDGGPVPAEVLSAFDRLLHALPDDTREMLRILPVDEQAEQALTAVAEAARVVPVAAQEPAPATEPEEETGPPTGAVVITADGRILPAEPILTVPSTHPATIDIQDGVLTIDLPEDEEKIPTVAAATIAPSVTPQTPVVQVPGSPPHPRLSSMAGAVAWASPVPVMPAAATTAPTGPAEAVPAAAASGAGVPAERAGTTVGPGMSAAPAVPAAVSAGPVTAPVGPAPAATSTGPVPASVWPGVAAVSDGQLPPAPAAAPTSPAAAGTAVETGVPAASVMPVPAAVSAGSVTAPVGPAVSAGSVGAVPVPVWPGVVAVSDGRLPSVPAAAPVSPAAAGTAVEPREPAASGGQLPAVPPAAFASVPVVPAAAAVAAGPVGAAPAAAMPASVGPTVPAAADGQLPAASVPAPVSPAAAVSAAGTPAGLGAPAAFEGQLPAPSALTQAASVPSQPVASASPSPAPVGPGMPVLSDGQLPVSPNAPASPALTPVAAVPAVSAATAPPATTTTLPAAAAPAAAVALAPVSGVLATAATVVPPVSSTDAGSAVDSVAGLLPGREVSRPAASTPVEVPEDARSTAEQRRAMRGKLGSRYDVATRAVTQLLSERPGLRFGAGDRAALLTELAVVRVFADEPDGEYDADFYTCLADGLRRLPTARTVVVRGIPQDTDLQPESVLRLPTPVVAASLATSDVGPAEALIWTTTARRLDGFFDEETAEVVLSGHTRLRVLAVEDRRVLLAEDGCAPAAALTRLRAAAAARAVPADPPATSRWFGPLPAA